MSLHTIYLYVNLRQAYTRNMLRIMSTPFLFIALISIAHRHTTFANSCSESSNIKLSIRTFRNGSGSWNSIGTQSSGEFLGVSKAEGILNSNHWSTNVGHGTDSGKKMYSATISVPSPRATPGYELFEGVGYYKFHDSPKKWLEALKVCQQEGAHLAIINSEKESSILKDLFNRHQNIHQADIQNSASIGFHDRYTEGQYLTVYVPRPHPSPAYELFEGVGYYKFHTDARIWMEGLRVCEQEGAHLAIINSEKEAEVLKKLFAKYPHIENADQTNVAGIGFHDRYKEGEYLTIFDEPLANTGFTRWSTIYNQPDNWQGSDTNPGEDCGSIQRDGGLNDVACDVRMVFICEQEL